MMRPPPALPCCAAGCLRHDRLSRERRSLLPRHRPGNQSSHLRAHTLQGLPIDRKSTRLNSSHGYISYAVFCLKKKNSSTTPTLTMTIPPTYASSPTTSSRRL